MKKQWIVMLGLVLLVMQSCYSQIDLRTQIQEYIQKQDAQIGFFYCNGNSADTVSVNSNLHCPTMSVYKLPISVAILHLVEKKKLDLNQKIFLDSNNLLENTWSPMREKYGRTGVFVTLKEILQFTISQSDNNGCDIIIKLAGGTKKVNAILKNIGIKNMQVGATELEMHQNAENCYKNWMTPEGSLVFLQQIKKQNILKKTQNDFLIKTMEETSTGLKRIRGNLPDSLVVAHKTGTGDTNSRGRIIAVNDIGWVQLNPKQYFYVSVFVTNMKGKHDQAEKIIADLSKICYDYYLSTKQ